VQYPRDNPGFERVATIDIETTHFKPRQGETVSVGIGVHDPGTPGEEATYEHFHRDENGEAGLIARAYDRLNELDADGLVTYNGRGFDFGFLVDRLSLLGEEFRDAALDTRETHVDLFEGRKAEADRQGKKWPSLEECLSAYDLTPSKTVWRGSEVTNTRFGEELGPAYLQAVDAESDEAEELREVIDHYLITDLEANFALYYADIGEEFEPAHVGTETFEI
jgi:hypothetical protein